MILHSQNFFASQVNPWKDILPLVSPIVVIILFIIDRIIGFKLRRKEVERNWYLKVLIEPCIDKISTFYKNILDEYKSSSHILSTTNQKFQTKYINIKAKEFGKFQSLKRELELDVIFPIQMRYGDVGEDILEQLRNLEDQFTSSLDNKKFSEDDIIQFHLFVAVNKANLLNYLYAPLQIGSSNNRRKH